jgi:hypothetical protein
LTGPFGREISNEGKEIFVTINLYAFLKPSLPLSLRTFVFLVMICSLYQKIKAKSLKEKKDLLPTLIV